MALRLFNSLTKQKEIFTPLDPEHVRMYVCGPTVYDFAHLGNARPVVVFDVLYRLLKHSFSKVTYVRNITDVDDKINAAAKAGMESIHDLTHRTTQAYHEDMAALNTLPPDIEPRATAHIPAMISMIQTLLEKGFAYVREGHVLFRCEKFSAYGRLSRRTLDEMIAGARVEIAPYKENPKDFVLWKPSLKDEPGWESPWGPGRPGWHIECSAMSAEYLGKTFDIHGGGIDLMFPHHENELAQSCAAHSMEGMATYWMHNGHLMVNGSKMSKSLGNFFTVRQLLSEHPGEVLRYALLMTHYRQPLDWKDTTPIQAKQALDKFYKVLQNRLFLEKKETPSQVFMEALFDDLNTPLALSVLHDLVTRYHLSQDPEILEELWASLRFLGLGEHDPKEWFQKKKPEESALTKKEIEKLLQERQKARAERNFSKADAIRTQLDEKGIVIEDTATGPSWRFKD